MAKAGSQVWILAFRTTYTTCIHIIRDLFYLSFSVICPFSLSCCSFIIFYFFLFYVYIFGLIIFCQFAFAYIPLFMFYVPNNLEKRVPFVTSSAINLHTLSFIRILIYALRSHKHALLFCFFFWWNRKILYLLILCTYVYRWLTDNLEQQLSKCALILG